jgi:DNA repair protein RadA/Sms
MAKTSNVFVCSNCGNTLGRWLGKCPQCGEFGTIAEGAPAQSVATTQAGLKSAGAMRPSTAASTLSEIGNNPVKRTPTGIGELDRVLGGGIVDAEVILFAGAPGSGKSTLSLRLADNYARMGKNVLYSSGEESKGQIALRAKRMGISDDRIRITNETSLEVLLGHIEDVQPELLIVDSLQTLASSEIPGSVGSISQSKEAANVLTRIAKTKNIAMILVNQILKSGDFAGSEGVLHIVDCGLMLQSDSESPLKFLRALKNRFGALEEVGVFQHAEDGLEEVTDPGSIFLDTGEGDEVQGASCGFISEGIRQIPIEVQALAVTSSLTNPRKQFNGVHPNRAQIICAILDKHCKTKTFDNDIFVSTVAGVKVVDPLADLAIAASLLSTMTGQLVSKKTVFAGELSLTGTVRGTYMIEAKIREAERLGFEQIVIPTTAKAQIRGRYSITISTITNVKELSTFLK